MIRNEANIMISLNTDDYILQIDDWYFIFVHF